MFRRCSHTSPTQGLCQQGRKVHSSQGIIQGGCSTRPQKKGERGNYKPCCGGPPSHSPPPSERVHETCLTRIGPGCCGVWRHQGRAPLRSSFGSSGSAAVLSGTGRVVCAEFLVKPKIGAESRVFRSKTGLETQDFFFPHWVRFIFSQYHLLQRLEYSNQSRCM